MTDQALEAFSAALLEDDARVLYDRAPCGYLSTDPDGLIVKANQTFLTLTGYQREDLVGRRRFVDLLAPGGRIYHETHYAPMLRMQGSVREIALDVVRADGVRLPVLVNAVLVRWADGSPRVVRMAVFDATERREYERELLRAKQRAEESEARAQQLARTLQQTLIPHAPPEIPGLEVAAAYRPAGSGAEVGGDFWDIFQLDADTWIVAIGDVCGKGADAAVVTALVRYTLRAAAVREPGLAGVLKIVNDVLRHETDRFCTAAVVRLVRRPGVGWHGTASAAGHPAPVLLPATGPVEVLPTVGGLLGVLPDPETHDVAVQLGPGDALLLYTDGVPEGRRGGAFYGEPRLLEVAASATGSAQSLVDGVLRDVLAFQHDQPRDDIAVVALAVPADP